MAVVVISGGNPVPLNVTAAPKQLADANVESTIINPAVDAAGNPAKLSFFGGAPVTQPIPAGNVHTVTAGSGNQVFVNTTFDGGIGTSAYTIGDIVAAIKDLNLAQISPSGTFVVPSAPVLTGNPSITGNPSVGQVLTAVHATYSGTVSSYNGQWYSGASPISGQTGLTYTAQSSDIGNLVTYQESASNLGGTSATGSSNGISISNFATPTLSILSATGTAPLVLGLTDTDYVAGLGLQLRFDQTSNAFSNVTQNVVSFIDGASWANLSESVGFTTPLGAYWAEARILRQNENGATSVTDQNGVTATYDASAWSNIVNDTIGGSVATLTTGTGGTGAGANRSQYTTVTSYELVMSTTNIGALCASRATIAAQNNKFHAEFKTRFFAASGGNSKCFFGFDDDVISFSTFVATASVPGTSGKNGFTVQIIKGGTPSIAINGSAFANLTGFAAVADGDVWSVDIDYSGTNPTVLITQYNGTAHVIDGGAITMTAGKPASWYAFAGGGSGNGTISSGNSDVVDFNPSSSVTAWLVTPQTGYQQYG